MIRFTTRKWKIVDEHGDSKNDEEIENREYTIKKNVKMDVDIDAVNWKKKWRWWITCHGWSEANRMKIEESEKFVVCSLGWGRRV